MRYIISILAVVFFGLSLQPTQGNDISVKVSAQGSQIQKLDTLQGHGSTLYSTTNSENHRIWAIENEDVEEEEKALNSNNQSSQNSFTQIRLVCSCLICCTESLTKVRLHLSEPSLFSAHKIPLFKEVCTYRI